MESFDLNLYDVIVFPFGGYGKAFPKARLEELRTWLLTGPAGPMRLLPCW